LSDVLLHCHVTDNRALTPDVLKSVAEISASDVDLAFSDLVKMTGQERTKAERGRKRQSIK
jgi:hypothetical protein